MSVPNAGAPIKSASNRSGDGDGGGDRLTMSGTFPAPTRRRVALLVINTSGLASAAFDAEHMAGLLEAYLRFEDLWVIFDDPAAAAQHQAGIQTMGRENRTRVRVSCAPAAKELLATITSWAHPLPPGADLVVDVSSHGYCAGERNFIVWCGSTVYDDAFHAALVDALHPRTRCLVLVDACACGTFLVLNHQSVDGRTYFAESQVLDRQHGNVVCISAVTNGQSDEDDISEYLGYGGGLACGFEDYVVEHHAAGGATPSIGGFFEYYKARIRPTGRCPVLSFNDPRFLS